MSHILPVNYDILGPDTAFIGQTGTGLHVPLPEAGDGTELFVNPTAFPHANFISFSLSGLEEHSQLRRLVSTLTGQETVNRLITGDRPESVQLGNEQAEMWIKFGHVAVSYMHEVNKLYGHK